MKRSFCTLVLVASLSCPLTTHTLLGTARYATAWGRRNASLDRATTHLQNPAHAHMFVSRYHVTYDDLDFLKQYLNELDKTRKAGPGTPRAYDIVKQIDVHDRLKSFTLEDAESNPRKFQELAARIILHHHR